MIGEKDFLSDWKMLTELLQPNFPIISIFGQFVIDYLDIRTTCDLESTILTVIGLFLQEKTRYLL